MFNVGKMKYVYVSLKDEHLQQMFVYSEELSFGEDKDIRKYLSEGGYAVHKIIVPEGLWRQGTEIEKLREASISGKE